MAQEGEEFKAEDRRPPGLSVEVAAQPIQDQVIWSEVRLSGKLPERRSNHCSFIVNEYLYIHGGRDIKEGPMSNMWRMSIGGIQELMEDPDHNVSWEPVKCSGAVPGNISHHKTAVFGLSVIIYGGISGLENFQDTFEFDSVKCHWSKIKQSGDIPKPRDDLSLSQINDNSFIIFGGFVQGSRVNECFIGTKTGNQLVWKQVGQNSPQQPCVRASHSSSVFNNKLYIFGGQDDENNKLNDLWEFDIESEVFSQIDLGEQSHQPGARSGHTSTIQNGQMYIFGGILELTKELNEMLCYNFGSKCFQCIGTDTNEQNQIQSNLRAQADAESPGTKKSMSIKKQVTSMPQGQSPTKLGNSYGSPSKTGNKLNLTAKARRAGKSPKKGVEAKEEKESGLASPTSISMQNSFIIKNADESFDAYYTQMRKRKLGGMGMDASMGPGQTGNLGQMQGSRESYFGIVPGIYPAARDGHTCEISEDGLMFVFGGDRHLMPFNDLYLMKL